MAEQSAITAGHKPGTSVQEIQKQWSKRAGLLNNGPVLSCAAMADAKTTKKDWKAPFKGRVTGVRCTVSNTAPAATATVAVDNATQSNQILSTATVALTSGFTLNTPKDMTLTSTAADLEFNEGDSLEVSWVTSGGSGAITDSQVQILVEPRD